MKANRMNIIEQIKKNRDLTIIYACAIVCSVVLILGWGVQISPDSPTYISAWENFSNGKIDVFRTPIYPFFLGTMKSMFGETYFRFATICVQHLIFLISTYYFYKTAQHFISVKRVVFLVSLFYATLSFFTTWNNCILTESLAISVMVILIYTIICLYQSQSWTSVIFYTSMLLMLIFLRPAFVYMLPILMATWLYLLLFKNKRKIAIKGISGTLVVIIALFSYMKTFECEYGLFTSSQVGTLNQVCIARQYGLFEPNSIQDPQLKAHIIESYKLYGKRRELEDVQMEIKGLMDNYDLHTLADAISESVKSNPQKWIASCGGRFMKSLDTSLFPKYLKETDKCGNIVLDLITIPLPMKILYLFLTIYPFVLCRWIVKKHAIPLLSFMFYLACISSIVVSIVGAQSEWSRLICPSMPLFLLMVGQICTLIKVKSISSIKFH